MILDEFGVEDTDPNKDSRKTTVGQYFGFVWG